jgi:O6-methylguanine-DNA--protein-cysteine methyltransferase
MKITGTGRKLRYIYNTRVKNISHRFEASSLTFYLSAINLYLGTKFLNQVWNLLQKLSWGTDLRGRFLNLFQHPNFASFKSWHLIKSKFANLQVPNLKSVQLMVARVARFFLVQNTKTGKCTKLPRTKPNVHKVYQKTVHKMDQVSIKYTDTLQCKTLQNLPKFTVLVWKQTIWQPWLGGFARWRSMGNVTGSERGRRRRGSYEGCSTCCRDTCCDTCYWCCYSFWYKPPDKRYQADDWSTSLRKC